MGAQVVMGAVLQCSFGVAPSSLVVLPVNKVLATTPAANILDNKPVLNIPPFGMCRSMSNPTVAAATAAAKGVLTPMPCVPATAAPWAPGCPKVMVGSAPALESNSKLMCSYGGVIQVVSPGQVKVIDG
ncbi:DUF4280 domain-containing protein [Myxococcus stipitatus]|uniref:DUF4280 domain-containing protein n=1 Tax=Myxococcus stipitatus TaxID=83455 RepID=UPI001F1A7FFA|nr:DUF4280 domain-containing protein [Myxococcus stipitatus]MCE9666986.1 DUF4280 domain-containing protein [Myxococcus stipitatus]